MDQALSNYFGDPKEFLDEGLYKKMLRYNFFTCVEFRFHVD